jgi:hypothetical protein
MLYCHSKGWRSAPDATLLRTYHYTLTKNLARSLILDYHRKRQPHLDRGLWDQYTFGTKQYSGAADIFRLPVDPCPAAGFAIADGNVKWETRGAIRSFRCPLRHWVEPHSPYETENPRRLPALLSSSIGCPIQGISSPTRGNTHPRTRGRLPWRSCPIVQKARRQVKCCGVRLESLFVRSLRMPRYRAETPRMHQCESAGGKSSPVGFAHGRPAHDFRLEAISKPCTTG